MYKRVLLCMPPLPGRYGWPSAPYTGIGYLSEVLTQNKIENDVIDLRLGYKLNDLIKKIEEFGPDLIGMTIMSYHRDVAYNLIKSIQNPVYQIVVGGPHASTYGHRTLEECVADFAIRLEGEYTLLELCKSKDIEKIEGLVYRDGNQIIENENRDFIRNLDELPFPKYEKFELEKYARKEIFIVSSRGCPQECIFCPIKVTVGRVWRARSAENVVEELKYWYERGYRTFQFADDNFSLSKERVLKICDLIEENNLSGISLNCPNGLRADRVDKELLQRMKEVGFKILCFGVETASNKVLKRIKKGENIQTIERAVRTACDLNFDVGLFFMVGHPTETPSDVEKSIKFALRYPIRNANFYNIVPFPGTELFEWVEKNNYFVQDPDKYLNSSAHFDEPIFETPEFPIKERRIMLEKTRVIERLIRKRDTEKRLKKYGILTKAATNIFFSKMVYSQILKMQAENRLFKKLLVFLANKFNLGYGI